MRATSAFVRLFIRGLDWDATAASATFASTIKLAAQAKIVSVNKGLFLALARSGDTETRFALPPADGLTAVDIAEVIARVLDTSDALLAATPDLTDAQLVAALLAAFPSIRTVQSDFRRVRV